MDNRHVDVLSIGRGNLEHALALLFAGHSTATHYLDVPADKEKKVPRTLVFCWHENSKGIPFPSPLDLDGAVEVAERWLAALPSKDRFGDYQDADVSTDPAFRVFCEDWGHVFRNNYAFAGVQGCYAWYGK